MKIGVFGGTFNPPHKGHILAAEEAKKQLGLDQILFVPAAQPPHKDLAPDSPDAKIRFRLTQAAIKDLPWASISDMEITRSGKSYTSDTLSQLTKKFPDAELYLLTGADMFLTLDTWHKPEEICSHAVIVGMYRDHGNTEAEMQTQAKKLQHLFDARAILLENEFIEVSSTDVRRMLILGGAEYRLPAPVWRMIQDEGLYGTANNYRGLSDEDLATVALGLLKPKRVPHVKGCAATARKLCEKWGGDSRVAYRAGLLHDVTKALEGPDQLLMADHYGIMVTNFERNNTKLLHAKTGAAVAREVFGESEEEAEAIRWHTTGKPNMNKMEKILYLADYMEPTRNFPGVDDLRALAFKDLDAALLLGLNMSIEELRSENKRICEDSLQARDYLAAQQKGNA